MRRPCRVSVNQFHLMPVTGTQTMSQDVAKKLKALVTLYGDEIADDPARFDALINRHCPGIKREAFVLTCAVRCGVVRHLTNRNPNRSIGVDIGKLSKLLQDNFGITQTLSEWAVKCWALAIGIAIENRPPAKSGVNVATPNNERKLREVILEVFSDRTVTDDERRQIDSLCTKLNISLDRASEIFAELKSSTDSGNFIQLPAGGQLGNDWSANGSTGKSKNSPPSKLSSVHAAFATLRGMLAILVIVAIVFVLIRANVIFDSAYSPSPSVLVSGKSTHVRSYFKRDGTFVRTHYRRR